VRALYQNHLFLRVLFERQCCLPGRHFQQSCATVLQ
jgi:hypothetical protein